MFKYLTTLAVIGVISMMFVQGSVADTESNNTISNNTTSNNTTDNTTCEGPTCVPAEPPAVKPPSMFSTSTTLRDYQGSSDAPPQTTGNVGIGSKGGPNGNGGYSQYNTPPSIKPKDDPIGSLWNKWTGGGGKWGIGFGTGGNGGHGGNVHFDY